MNIENSVKVAKTGLGLDVAIAPTIHSGKQLLPYFAANTAVFSLALSLSSILFSASAFANTPSTELSSDEFSSTSAAENGQENNENDENWGDDWDDDWQEESPWQFSGFSELAFGRFTQSNSAIDSNNSLAEARARFEVNYSHQVFEFAASGDLLFDQVTKDTRWNTRELTISASPFSALDIKVGRQVLTWGTGDYLFLNDMFAKDWQSFFSGRDDEYLKAPSNSVRLTSYLADVTFDFVWTPDFTPDNYLTGERFSFYSPIAGENIAPADNFIVETTNSSQFSARLSTSINGVEYALYGYQGFWTTPQGSKIGYSPNASLSSDEPISSYYYFPELTTWGASALTPVNTPLGSGIFNAEFAYYDSKEDSDGTNPLIANSQFKALVGYEQEVAKNLTASMQYYLEKTLDYTALKQSYPFPETLVDENRHVLTLRLRYSAMQQKLTANLFSFYSPSDKDAYIKPLVNYRYNDNLSFAAGANIFLGKHQHSFFGQHQDNSNAWLRVRYSY